MSLPIERKSSFVPGIVAHAYNPSTRENEAGGTTKVLVQPDLHSEMGASQSYIVRLPQENNKQTNENNNNKTHKMPVGPLTGTNSVSQKIQTMSTTLTLLTNNRACLSIYTGFLQFLFTKFYHFQS